jgi:hypothetical protein
MLMDHPATAEECREHALQCRRLAEMVPDKRLQLQLLQIAATWDQLPADTHRRKVTPPTRCRIATVLVTWATVDDLAFFEKTD